MNNQPWNCNTYYSMGQVVEYEGRHYESIQAHQSQSDWSPDNAQSLWKHHKGQHHKEGHHDEGRHNEGRYNDDRKEGRYNDDRNDDYKEGRYNDDRKEGRHNEGSHGGYNAQNNTSSQGMSAPMYGQQQGTYGAQSQGVPGYQQQPQTGMGMSNQSTYQQPQQQQSTYQQPQQSEKSASGLASMLPTSMQGMSDLQLGGLAAGGLLGVAGLAGAIAYGVGQHNQNKAERSSRAAWESEATTRSQHYLQALNSGQQVPPVAWVMTEGNNIPRNAIQGGNEANGEAIFICRTWHENGVHVGKTIRAWSKGCSIGYGGKEISGIAKFEVLCGDMRAIRWNDNSGSLNAQNFQRLVEGGHEADGSPIFIAQAFYENGVQIGKASTGKHAGCYVGYGGKEVCISNYKVLTLN